MFPQTAAQLPRELFPQLVGPGAFYMTGEDQLVLATYNSLAGVVVTFVGRFLTLDGRVVPFEHRQTPNTDRTIRTSLLPLGEGWLLNVAAHVSTGAPVVGQTFARVTVIRGGLGATQELATLLAGYITAGSRRAWPGSPIASPLDGPGCVRNVLGNDPAVNFEVSVTVPTGARWRLMNFYVELTTDANVANRTPIFAFAASGNGNFMTVAPTDPQVASTTVAYMLGAFGASRSPSIGGSREISIPPIVLPAGATIDTVTVNMQAGDNYAAPRLLVEEWIDA